MTIRPGRWLIRKQHVGYHYHAVNEACHVHSQEGAAPHAPGVGLALDGHVITTHLNADETTPQDLDACYGHTSEDL